MRAIPIDVSRTTIPDPTPEEIRRLMQEGRRLRAEFVHELMKSACKRLASTFRAPATAGGGGVVRSASRA